MKSHNAEFVQRSSSISIRPAVGITALALGIGVATCYHSSGEINKLSPNSKRKAARRKTSCDAFNI